MSEADEQRARWSSGATCARSPCSTSQTAASATARGREPEAAGREGGRDVEYAPYVEEGTSRMKGKHFLRKAATGHGDTYRAILEKHLRGGA